MDKFISREGLVAPLDRANVEHAQRHFLCDPSLFCADGKREPELPGRRPVPPEEGDFEVDPLDCTEQDNTLDDSGLIQRVPGFNNIADRT